MFSMLIDEQQKELAPELRLHNMDGISWQQVGLFSPAITDISISISIRVNW